MYVLWGRGSTPFDFGNNNQSLEVPKILKHNNGNAMMQLLRADKIRIREKYKYFNS